MSCGVILRAVARGGGCGGSAVDSDDLFMQNSHEVVSLLRLMNRLVNTGVSLNFASN